MGAMTVSGHATPTLPHDRIRVKNGQVVHISQFTLWNNEPWETMTIQRKAPDLFYMAMGEPEHGGGSTEGTLDEVLAGLHPNIAENIRLILTATNPDEHTLHQLWGSRNRLDVEMVQ